MDYLAAAEDLEYLLGVKVSSKQAQLVTREAGQKALSLEKRQCEEWSRPWSPEQPVAEEKPRQALVLEMDGTCVQGRMANWFGSGGGFVQESDQGTHGRIRSALVQ